jgi:ribonucleoside-diphosphate reductase alpha chain
MGIEPIKSNYFIKDLAKSKTIYRIRFWKLNWINGLNAKYGRAFEKWMLSATLGFPIKEVFKSFIEISQKNLYYKRQAYIDQSQS